MNISQLDNKTPRANYWIEWWQNPGGLYQALLFQEGYETNWAGSSSFDKATCIRRCADSAPYGTTVSIHEVSKPF